VLQGVDFITSLKVGSPDSFKEKDGFIPAVQLTAFERRVLKWYQFPAYAGYVCDRAAEIRGQNKQDTQYAQSLQSLS
jgi:hypothetical protein